MKTSKIAFATASALLLTTAFSSAQTTIGGNMWVGYKATSSDLGAGLGSNRGFTKETQINVANKGKLNIGGLEYAAGFSIELDGSDLNTTGATTASFGGTHYENTFIDIINPATKTTLSFGSDHVKPSDVQLSDIIGGPLRVDHVTDNLGVASTGAAVESKYTKYNAKGGAEGFAFGLIQEVGTIGAIRATYQPDTSGSGSATGDTGGDLNSLRTVTTNALLDYGFRGSLGVPGLDIHLARNVQDGTGTARDIKFHIEGIKYTMGPITGAYHQATGDVSATSEVKTKEYGLAYTVSKDLSVGLVMIKTTDKDSASASNVDEKIKGINIGYSLGPILLQTVAGKIENANNVINQDGKAIQLTLGATF